ncbi:MAG: class I SAM-dependent RNA methyltransferase [Alphaproteobacteria bacterium]|nr:class I SAM-dependent RNA methyltransferase [Alphaproteobacteria bacterium]
MARRRHRAEPDQRRRRECGIPHRGAAGRRVRAAGPRSEVRCVALEIGEIGARGDGIARHEGGPIYVPFTAPGDRILARLDPARGEGRRGRLERILVAGPGRTIPVCRHFGTCGGCALQHLESAHYAAAKLRILREALARHGLADAPLAPLQLLPPGTRRRVRWALARARGGAGEPRLGFAERASHRIVDLAACAVLDRRLFALAGPLRRLAAVLLEPGEAGHASLQAVESGVDLVLDLPRPPGLCALEALAEFAAAQDLARLEWRRPGDPITVPIARRRAVRACFSGVEVDLPPDCFLQATPEAEASLRQAVLAALAGARRIADLFCGVGTFTFALAAQGRVHAVEGWAPAVAALGAAARRTGLGARVSAETRDLDARPLEPAELQAYDAVVFDPPRGGARAQAAALARSRIPAIAAISCNPSTFARDARILVDGGYRLVSIQPIDQFVWSAQIELVAAFVR